MIVPTVGRVVLYIPDDYDIEHRGMKRRGDQPFKADVVYVWSDTCVNLRVYDHDGYGYARSSVTINVDDAPKPRAEWMAYQKQVAAGAVPPTLHAASEKA